MSNKFLGLNSVNVFKSYIDEQLKDANINTRIITVQAYSYQVTGITPVVPTGGGFDAEAITIVYPEYWNSLKHVLNRLEETYGDLDNALSNGSIWMSVGVIEGNKTIEWSTPMKVSGQNGINIQFAYSYNENAAESERTNTPTGVNSENRVEWVWTKIGENNWEGPTIWAMYAQDARDVLWRYCVTKDLITPNKPAIGDSTWSKNLITQDLSKDYPYMWMSYQIVPAGQIENDDNWTEPILFGHWGMDGADGNVPDYTQTLYHKGLSNPEISDITGIIAPEKPEYIEDALITDYIKDGWVELPTEPEVEEGEEPVLDTTIWWQCTIKVDGKTNKVLSTDSIGAVKRYNAIDGTAKAGPFTINLYAWSSTQEQPEMSDKLIDDWRPENYNYLPDKPFDENGNILQEFNNPEASLWMITANVAGLDEDGKPIVNGSWSEPIKLTGPRGPIAYDYRIETRYMIGTVDKPQYSSNESEWSKTIPNITSEYQYIWAQQYLVYYSMKYNIDGTIVQDNDVQPVIIEKYGEYRLSGINGLNGNIKNNINYTDNENSIDVKSFSTENLYVYNGNTNITYNMKLDVLTFIQGYTAKFANIGTGTVTLNADSYQFVASDKTTKELTLNPQETVELICYNLNNIKSFLVLGKTI